MAVGMLVAEAELVFDPEDVAYTVGGMLERHPLPFQTFASAASATIQPYEASTPILQHPCHIVALQSQRCTAPLC